MKAFFDKIRPVFGGSLSQAQVDGINVLLHATAGLPVKHRAYILATATHETARSMQPITEYGARSYFNKYEPNTDKGVELGNTIMGDGYKYRGRGYVQITGRANYQKASLATGRDLVADPDKALEPEVAAFIIVKGMMQGWFTGKKLSDYSNYIDMRRVVNGTDMAATIAEYAEWFEHALTVAGNGTRPVSPPKPSEPPVLDFTPATQPEKGTTVMNTNALHNILNFVGLIIGGMITFDWTALGLSAESAAMLAGWVLVGDKVIKFAINIMRDGLGGLFKPQPPVIK